MSSIAAVVFDIGNVLIEWNPERVYDRLIGPARRAALFDAVDLHGMNARVDLGEALGEAVAHLARAEPDWADEIAIWHDRWIEMASPAIPRSVRLLRALRRAEVPVFALTNFGADTFALAGEHYPFLTEFDASFVSGRLRMAKPEPEIYAALEQGTGVAPGRLLFADDRAENVAAAAARGWRTHHFTGPDGLAERLVSEGLLTEQEAA
ncbi:HAD family hydrolase [Limimaricola pyoseonensis]|uniref:2-haloacid dehalogenase n=1 Tax=Limimaricola pyoseonensis TaxID=521013 RepID=A0A1G7EB90_9RHOB|nr:HAD family phosphatase [Limimaricola pyoseonensis]SDE60635.1 2-haloacid dehalogenase [Limimaricola pyoseonensis]